MANYKKEIEKILKENDCYKIPVPIVELAAKLGFGVYKQKMPKNCSGVIVVNQTEEIENGFKKIIAVNESDVYVRQRFTVAHELAHYFRNEKETIYAHRETGVRNQEEIDMDNYAGQLIMPFELIDKFVKKARRELTDDEYIIILKIAQEFLVSIKAAEIRYNNYLRGI